MSYDIGTVAVPTEENFYQESRECLSTKLNFHGRGSPESLALRWSAFGER